MENYEPEPVEDLDPYRTATYLEGGVPYCYLGHPECYDLHTAERLSDDADYEHEESNYANERRAC